MAASVSKRRGRKQATTSPDSVAARQVLNNPPTPDFEMHGKISDEGIDALARLLLSIAEHEIGTDEDHHLELEAGSGALHVDPNNGKSPLPAF